MERGRAARVEAADGTNARPQGEHPV